jgi:hypothetical protein
MSDLAALLAGLSPAEQAQLRASIASGGAGNGGSFGDLLNYAGSLGGSGFAPQPGQGGPRSLSPHAYQAQQSQNTTVNVNNQAALPPPPDLGGAGGEPLPEPGSAAERGYIFANALPGMATGLSRLRPGASLGETLNAGLGGLLQGMGSVKSGLRQERREERQDAQTTLQNALKMDELKRQQEERDHVEKAIAGMSPEEQQKFRLLRGIGANEQAAGLVAPPQMTLYQAEQVRLEEAAIAQRQAELAQAGQPTWYQKASIALERDQLNAAKNQPRAASWETVQDPNNPNLSMIIDKNTMQPVMGPDGQPLRPAATRDTGAGIKNAKDLRDALDRQTGEAKQAATAYRKVENAFALDSGPGDIAGIFGFMKSIDPTSTVREGEFATAENSGGISETWRNWYNKTVRGERLPPAVRTQILGASASQVKAYQPAYDQTTRNFAALAEAQGVDPSQVVMPFDWPSMGAEQFQPLPSGGMAQTGPGLISSATAAPATPARAPVSAKKIISDVFGD